MLKSIGSERVEQGLASEQAEKNNSNKGKGMNVFLLQRKQGILNPSALSMDDKKYIQGYSLQHC